MAGTSSYRSGSDYEGADTFGSDAASSVRERAETAINAVTEQGSRVVAQAERRAEDAYYATRRFVEEQPFVALAGITAFAFIAGALWRLGSQRRRFGDELVDRVTDFMHPRGHMASMRRRSRVFSG